MKVNKTIFLLVVGLMILPAFGDGIEIQLSGITNENYDETDEDGYVLPQIALSATFVLSYDGIDTLRVLVTNNSPEYSQISEIYLNLPIGSEIEDMIMSVSNNNWIEIFDPENAGAAHDQYGIFDFGAKLKKKKDGISPGITLVFEFKFIEGDGGEDGGMLANLTTEDFASALSTSEFGGPVSIFEAKWTKITGDGYEEQSGWGGAVAPTPEPGTLLLLGSGLLAGGSFLRKKFKR